MTKLKLGPPNDDKPVKVGIQLPSRLTAHFCSSTPMQGR